MFDPLNLNRNSIVNKFAVLWIQFSFSDQQMYQLRYKLMKSVKIKKIDKRNECVINFYKLIDIESISIKSDLPIFIDWPLRDVRP